MTKICFFATNYDHTRQKLIDYYEHVLSKKAELFLFCKDSEIEKYHNKSFIKYGYSGSKLTLPFKLRKFCKDNNIDILVGFSGAGEVSAVLVFATLLTRTKYIAHIHGNFFWKSKDIGDFRFFVYTLQYNLKSSFFIISQFFAKRLLLCSETMTYKLRRLFFLNKHKIEYVPSVIETDFYRPKDKLKSRKNLGLKSKDKILLYVGRVSYLKGSDWLIKLIKRNTDKKFVLVGALKTRQLEKEHFKNVIFVQSAAGETLVDYYNAADIFLFLSRTEGNPLALREAMACGLPSIALDIESLSSLKPVIKLPRRIDILQQKIVEFFNLSKKEKKKISDKSRKFILKEYSPDVWNKKYKSYFLNFN